MMMKYYFDLPMNKNYSLPPLNFKFNELEPYLDAKTVEIHYTKHHQSYVDNVNALLQTYPMANNHSLEDLLRNPETIQMQDKDKIKFINNAGGYLNHNLYWKLLGANKQIDKSLVREINRVFGSLEQFKKIFSETASGQFASGWCWLVNDELNRLKIYNLPNHATPIQQGHVPILVLDLWEHSYYLKYQNKRNEYINNWWHILTLI